MHPRLEGAPHPSVLISCTSQGSCSSLQIPDHTPGVSRLARLPCASWFLLVCVHGGAYLGTRLPLLPTRVAACLVPALQPSRSLHAIFVRPSGCRMQNERTIISGKSVGEAALRSTFVIIKQPRDCRTQQARRLTLDKCGQNADVGIRPGSLQSQLDSR